VQAVNSGECQCYFRRLTTAQNADEFYTLMGDLTQEMQDGKIIDEDVLIEVRIAMNKTLK